MQLLVDGGQDRLRTALSRETRRALKYREHHVRELLPEEKKRKQGNILQFTS